MKILAKLRWVFLGAAIGCFFDALALQYDGNPYAVRFAIAAAVCSVLYVLGELAK